MGVVRVSVVRARLVIRCIVALVRHVARRRGAFPVTAGTTTMPALIATLGVVPLRGLALVRAKVL